LIERAVAAGFPISPTYGLTEASSQVATRPPGAVSAPAGGGLRSLVGTEVRIADDAGRECPAGNPGEVQVRGPTVMRGYLDQPDATAAAFAGGWLRTGDEGIRDIDGGITILDRRSDLIVSGGENIYPSEVEAVLLSHPAIADAGVAAEPDTEFGQRPAAYLVLRPGETLAADELRAFCRTRLAAFKIPVRFECVEGLPRTGSGKLKRRQLATPTRKPA
jgi:O-succinylbenzoic acid--CoA ligase